MRGFWQYEVKRNYDARYIYHLGDRICNYVLERLRLEAERACKYSGERPFAEIFLSSKSIVDILDDKIKDVFRHMMNFSPKFASMLP